MIATEWIADYESDGHPEKNQEANAEALRATNSGRGSPFHNHEIIRKGFVSDQMKVPDELSDELSDELEGELSTQF